MIKVVADLHTHSISSGHAYSTIGDIIVAAQKRELKAVAITDHGPALPGGPHPYHFCNLRIIPEQVDDVYVLKGIEANIMDVEGSLDLSRERLLALDVVLAGLHTFCSPNNGKNGNTKMLIDTMKNDVVDIITHPGNPEYEINIDEFVRAAVDLQVAIEINNSSFLCSRLGSDNNCRIIAEKAAKYGAKIAINSDAHYSAAVGVLNMATEVVQTAGICETNVINCSCESLVKHLNRTYKKINIFQ